MLTDRQRVEAGIIPALIYGAIKPFEQDQITDDEKSRCKVILDACKQAMLDPVDDLIEPRRSQILRRSDRLFRHLVRGVLDGTSCTQMAVATYYLLEELLQEGRLTIYEDSYFGQALLVFMEDIDCLFSIEKLDAAAQKRARQMREAMRAEGYFR